MLVEFETKKYDVKRLFFTDAAGRRRALLAAMKVHQFEYAEPKPENLGVMRDAVDAYNLPQEVVDMMGEYLVRDINKKRTLVRNALARRKNEYEAVVLRDQLLAMPIAEAVNMKQLLPNGELVNAVDHIAPILNDIYKNYTNDGYRHNELYTIEKAEMA
jgi:hypothetical protein